MDSFSTKDIACAQFDTKLFLCSQSCGNHSLGFIKSSTTRDELRRIFSLSETLNIVTKEEIHISHWCFATMFEHTAQESSRTFWKGWPDGSYLALLMSPGLDDSISGQIFFNMSLYFWVLNSVGHTMAWQPTCKKTKTVFISKESYFCWSNVGLLIWVEIKLNHLPSVGHAPLPSVGMLGLQTPGQNKR